MPRSLKAALALAGALLVGACIGAMSRPAPAYAEEAPRHQKRKPADEPPPDPKKKSAGDACTSSDECQKHHTCTKVGDKSVCKAPERSKLPPGAVT